MLLGCYILIRSSLYAQNNFDSISIRKTALDYMEGWYSGDVIRMSSALHPDLAKRTIRLTDTINRKQYLASVSANTMIMQTEAGFGKKMKGVNKEINFLLLDRKDDLAMVRIITDDFIDYLQLGKLNGEWKIINVLWTNNKTQQLK